MNSRISFEFAGGSESLALTVHDVDDDTNNEKTPDEDTSSAFAPSLPVPSLYPHEHHLKHIRRHFYLRVSRLYEVEDQDRIPGLFRQCTSLFGAISERSIERIHLFCSFCCLFASFSWQAICEHKSVLLPSFGTSRTRLITHLRLAATRADAHSS
jgi:hypothetical protein